MDDMDTESMSSYDSIKNKPILLNSLRGKYVTLQLIQKRTQNGFVQAIDPEGYSIILLELNGDTYQTNLIPGHAILGISVRELIPGLKLVNKAKTNTTLQEKKRKLMLWFKKNLLAVTEKDDNIVFKNVLILPPYDTKSIYSTNVIVNKQVRDIIEKMPEQFTE